MSDGPFIPSKKQSYDILQAIKHRYTFLSGAVRSSKTYVLLFLLPIMVKIHWNETICISAKTYQVTEQNILTPARKMYGKNAIGRIINHDYVDIFGKKVLVRPYNDASSYTKIQGSSIQCLFLDEAVLCNEDFFRMALTRLDSPTAHMILTANPSYEKHFVRMWALSKGEELYWSNYTIDDNPHLDPKVVRDLKSSFKGNDAFYRRYILGEWCSAEGLAYYAFDPKVNTISLSELDINNLRRNAYCCLLGVDGSVVRDETTAAPIIITRNEIAYVFPLYGYDPKAAGPIDDTRQSKKISQFVNDFFDKICDQYYDVRCIIDGACTNLALALDEVLDMPVIRFTQKNRARMDGVLNSLFTNKKIFIIKEGNEKLIEQLQSVTIKEKTNGTYDLNPENPNDRIDSIIYPLSFYYKFDFNSEDIPE